MLFLIPLALASGDREECEAIVRVTSVQQAKHGQVLVRAEILASKGSRFCLNTDVERETLSYSDPEDKAPRVGDRVHVAGWHEDEWGGAYGDLSTWKVLPEPGATER